MQDLDRAAQRLDRGWRAAAGGEARQTLVDLALTPEIRDRIDLFDRVQLAEVLRVCASASSLSDAGRRLFSVSRARKASPNDADRLRKYLARFGLEWKSVRGLRIIP